jgi:hypothetical protein
MTRVVWCAAIAALLIAHAHAQPVDECLDAKTREHVRTIMLSALDRGLRDHTKHLFETWMKDPTDQPARAIAGIKPAINSYIGARNAALNWSPPLCPKEK